MLAVIPLILQNEQSWPITSLPQFQIQVTTGLKNYGVSVSGLFSSNSAALGKNRTSHLEPSPPTYCSLIKLHQLVLSEKCGTHGDRVSSQVDVSPGGEEFPDLLETADQQIMTLERIEARSIIEFNTPLFKIFNPLFS
jgi:hypothetical protein